MVQKPTPPDWRHIIRFGRRKKFLGGALSCAAAVLRCFNALFRARTMEKKVLLLEPFGLGDLISMQPLVDSLLERGYQVVLCGHQAWHSLFPPRAGFVWLDAGLPWGTHDEKAKYRFSSYLDPAFRKFFRRLRHEGRGGIGVDTRGDIRSIIALYSAGCSRVRSLSHYTGSDLRVPSLAAEIVPVSRGLRRWEMNMRFLDAIGAGPAPRPMAPPRFPHLRSQSPGLSSPTAGEVASAEMAGIIGIIPVVPWKGKLWVPLRWAELIATLDREGFTCRSLCGPGQENLAREQTGAIAVTRCGSIEEWARAISGCRLVVALDTGPMHLADALGVPVVVLYGVSVLPLWAPSGPGSAVIAHQDAPDFAACQQVEKTSELGRKAMEMISVAEVLTAVRQGMHAPGKGGFNQEVGRG